PRSFSSAAASHARSLPNPDHHHGGGLKIRPYAQWRSRRFHISSRLPVLQNAHSKCGGPPDRRPPRPPVAQDECGPAVLFSPAAPPPPPIPPQGPAVARPFPIRSFQHWLRFSMPYEILQ